jgi:acetyl-CoA carboxylase alpha subunit/acetyl-CoA carboxylase beta subunit
MPDRLRAEEWAGLLLDAGPEPLEAPSSAANPLRWPGYDALRAEAPGDEAVRAWCGCVDGLPVVLVAFDFAHLGGSMGAGVGALVSQAFEEAARRRVPVVTVTATGGARMQEGMVSLAQMARTTVAAQRHREAGLLQLTVATDPTTGGVYVSFAAQADLLFADPGAYVAFAGPRVAASMGGSADAANANRAESVWAQGLIDEVVPRGSLRARIAAALHAIAPADPARVGSVRSQLPEATRPGGAAPTGTAWERVLGARSPERPRASDFLPLFDQVIRYSGDRAGGRDESVIAALCRYKGQPLGLVALDRGAVRPSGYRTAWRLLDTAARLRLPVLTLVDTPGADLSRDAELAGQARAIAETFDRLLRLSVPTTALVIGEGGSGGALALAATDRLLVQAGAVFSVIAPEGAAAILHRDPSRAPDVAELLDPTAEKLVELGIAHGVAPDAPEDALELAVASLRELAGTAPAELLERRRAHWGSVGR